MSKTIRHRDFWKMRQIRKGQSPMHGYGSPVMSDRGFVRLFAKYGYKARVFDKRRRVSTRKANSEHVRVLRRAARREARETLSPESSPGDYDRILRRIRPSRP